MSTSVEADKWPAHPVADLSSNSCPFQPWWWAHSEENPELMELLGNHVMTTFALKERETTTQPVCSVHPAALVFPEMSPADLDGLVEDIKQNGLAPTPGKHRSTNSKAPETKAGIAKENQIDNRYQFNPISVPPCREERGFWQCE